MESLMRFTSTRRVASCAAFLGLMAAPLAASLAAPPGGGSTPPSVDIAYMSITSSAWGEPNSATVRGLGVSEAGASIGDTSLWKSAKVYYNSMTWDPDGTWLAWAQYIDTKGTRALVVGKPGGTLQTLLRFPSGAITRRNGLDNIAWGRGCQGRSFIVFNGDEGWGLLDNLYVIDPFVAFPNPVRLYTRIQSPDPDSDGHGHGLAVSPSGHHLAFVEYTPFGIESVVALPLTCIGNDPLPVAAGGAQALFPVEYDGGNATTQSLDWSPDGSRLAVSIAAKYKIPGGWQWGFSRLAVGELSYHYDPASGTEQVAAAAAGLRRITTGPTDGSPDYMDQYPSWGPSEALAVCDRLAFNRDGAILLLDVPRDAFPTEACTIPAPKLIGGKTVTGMDWK